jgi:hypothetical protein
MKNCRTYDFNNERLARQPNSAVRELLIDGWSAYFKWRARLRKRLASSRPR